ncbi:MAG: AAA family ATPase [Candidatus Scalinduaceae bacterium]
MVIGSVREKEGIIDAILKRNNLFLYGPKGVGKTFIVKHVLKETDGKNILYSKDGATLKTSLIGFLEGDFENSFLSSQNILSLKKLFYKKIKKENPYLVFDHTGRVGPKFFSFIENLLDEYSMLIIARSRHSNEIGDLYLLLYSFDKLEIPNLNREHAAKLTDYFVKSFNLVIYKPDYFKQRVFSISCGNPSAIKEICQYAMESRYKIGEKIYFNLLNLDREIDSLKL